MVRFTYSVWVWINHQSRCSALPAAQVKIRDSSPRCPKNNNNNATLFKVLEKGCQPPIYSHIYFQAVGHIIAQNKMSSKLHTIISTIIIIIIYIGVYYLDVY